MGLREVLGSCQFSRELLLVLAASLREVLKGEWVVLWSKSNKGPGVNSCYRTSLWVWTAAYVSRVWQDSWDQPLSTRLWGWMAANTVVERTVTLSMKMCWQVHLWFSVPVPAPVIKSSFFQLKLISEVKPYLPLKDLERSNTCVHNITSRLLQCVARRDGWLIHPKINWDPITPWRFLYY